MTPVIPAARPYNARPWLRPPPTLWTTFAQADPGRLLEHEWLLTHGTGGFAMGTALGANTRRYHGLLIAAAKPPVDRVVVLHQVVQELILTRGDGTTHTLTLGPMLFRGDDGRRVIAPDDTGMLRRFDHGLDSAWSYVYEGLWRLLAD